jgi:hypothetical protein
MDRQIEPPYLCLILIWRIHILFYNVAIWSWKLGDSSDVHTT